MGPDRRETFRSRFGLLMTMIGVAVGLGNVWRFPYLVGRYGGAAFVGVYVLAVFLVGIPALIAEWSLGRATRRGPAGAFERAGFPMGRRVGWLLFLAILGGAGYYTNAVGWVLYSAACEVAGMAGFACDAQAILPPGSGFSVGSFVRQIVCTSIVIVACVLVLLAGLRAGIERASRYLMPALLGILLVLVARTLTLPGAEKGVEWYILKFRPSDLDGSVVLAALGQAAFSLSLGGTFMVIYGSYLDDRARLAENAVWTAVGDLGAGLLAGLAIIPAVVAFGLEPGSGPGLLFHTLPRVFAELPLGGLFGALFFAGLLGAAYLSDVAAFEVLVGGITDNTRVGRRRAVWLVGGLVLLVAIPSMVNMRVFVPWDLTFGSGMQTFGSLMAVLAVAWSLDRSRALRQLASSPDASPRFVLLYYWLRFAVPGAILAVGVWWVLSDVLGMM